jgi:hypothetical protein
MHAPVVLAVRTRWELRDGRVSERGVGFAGVGYDEPVR